MTTPDPLDGLKFAFACAHNSDPQNPLRDTLSLLLQRFVHMDTEVNDLHYSDGSPVFVVTEVEPGVTMRSHFPPPGYNERAAGGPTAAR